MYASVALRAGAPDHSTSDVFGTGSIRSATGMARSRDGVTWKWEGPVLEPSGRGWDAYETRISCLLSEDVTLYDGIARAEDNYAERTGIARRGPNGRWTRLTTAAPVLAARYVAFDGERFFWEHELADGSHELRVSPPGPAFDAGAVLSDAPQPRVAVATDSTGGR